MAFLVTSVVELRLWMGLELNNMIQAQGLQKMCDVACSYSFRVSTTDCNIQLCPVTGLGVIAYSVKH